MASTPDVTEYPTPYVIYCLPPYSVDARFAPAWKVRTGEAFCALVLNIFGNDTS